MLMTELKAEGIAIPMELIQQWRERKDYLDRMASDAQRESAEISRKLDAVAILAPELSTPGFSLTSPDVVTEAPSVISELGKAVAERNRLMPPLEIRKVLRQREGVPKFSDNYFYTALKRALEKGLIRKVGDLYGPVDTGSP